MFFTEKLVSAGNNSIFVVLLDYVIGDQGFSAYDLNTDFVEQYLAVCYLCFVGDADFYARTYIIVYYTLIDSWT